jgi:serine protease Do
MSYARGTRLRVGGVAIVAAAVLATVGFTKTSLWGASATQAVSVAAVSKSASPPSAAIARLEEISDAFADVAARVKPSVVYIVAKHTAQTVSRSQRGGAPGQALPPDIAPFFRGMPGMPGQGQGGPDGPEMPEEGEGIASGSGFIVSPDGYILTNNHVVEGASSVTVRLLDRREFKARVVGADAATDVAVLKITATGLDAAPLGNSDSARVGEWVLAVGNPLGENLTFTVTQGIVSAKGRTALGLQRSQRSIQDFIQTDAAINPGNSGGPLVNVRGEVIGINAAIESPTGYNTGYGFAVPMNLARTVMQQIIATGHVERAALGVTVRDASADDAAYAGLSTIGGVLVQDYADADSPARRAGLQPGDVIIAVDGHQVNYVAQLQEAIAFRKPGDVVTLEVARKGGARATVRVPLQSVGGEQVASQTRGGGRNEESGNGSAAPMLGVTVAPTDQSVVDQLQLPDGVRGVVVTNVDDNGPAAGRLATPDQGGPDIILSVEGTPVATPDALRQALSAASHAAENGGAPIVSVRIYNVPSKTKRIERIRLTTSAN